MLLEIFINTCYNEDKQAKGDSALKVIRYKPLLDKLFFIILIPTVILLVTGTVFAAFDTFALFIMIPADLFALYFLVSPLFGYVELRENTLFIKFGFFMKREIAYEKIRGTVKERKFYSESIMSLKNAVEHINVKYNTFDTVTLSVKDNDGFIAELGTRVEKIKSQ